MKYHYVKKVTPSSSTEDPKHYTYPANDWQMMPQNDDSYNDDSYNDDREKSRKRDKKKTKIEYIDDKARRHITFSNRKKGIMKKAYELSVLTGSQVLLLAVNEKREVFSFTTPKLTPIVTNPTNRSFIEQYLNAPDVNQR